MFVDSTGSLGVEHSRDLRRAGRAYRIARAVDATTAHRHVVRAFIARGQLGPVDNYRVR
jgi:hypothetical protein